jgi:hypothetical protein
VAITPFPATYQTSSLEIAQLLLKSPLDGGESNEVLRALDAVQVWREWFCERYGELVEIWHHSNPDDPPDLDLLFEKGQIGLEQTSLMPHPLGYAKAIAKEVNPGGGRLLPGVSQEWTREELERLCFPRTSDAPWAAVGDEHRVAFEKLVSTLRKKMKEPASRVISIYDETTFGGADTEWQTSGLHRVVNSVEFADYGDRTVIFLQRDNDTRFFSALIRRGEPIQAKRDGKIALPRKPLSFV